MLDYRKNNRRSTKIYYCILGRRQVLMQLHHLYFIAAATMAGTFLHSALVTLIAFAHAYFNRTYFIHTVMHIYREARADHEIKKQQ